MKNLSLLLLILIALSGTAITEAKLRAQCKGEECYTQGTCLDFIKLSNGSSSGLQTGPNGACFRSNDVEDGKLILQFRNPVTEIVFEMRIRNRASSHLIVKALDQFHEDADLDLLDSRPYIIEGQTHYNPGQEGGIHIGTEAVTFNVRENDQEDSDRERIAIPVYFPLGPHQIEVLLRKRVNGGLTTDTAIGNITVVSNKYVKRKIRGSSSPVTPSGRYNSQTLVCIKTSYDRGVGTIPSECRTGQERNGALCYPLCRDGFYGVGPICWESCRSGYTDIGAICSWPVKLVARTGCEWYDYCNVFGTCDPCPADTTDLGCTCGTGDKSYAKKSYGRGAGYPMICSSSLDSQAGLCYRKCNAGYIGFVTMCLKNCPSEFPFDDGAVCSKDVAGFVKWMSLMATYAAANVVFLTACSAAGVFTAGLATAGCIGAFVGLCSTTAGAALGMQIC